MQHSEVRFAEQTSLFACLREAQGSQLRAWVMDPINSVFPPEACRTKAMAGSLVLMPIAVLSISQMLLLQVVRLVR